MTHPLTCATYWLEYMTAIIYKSISYTIAPSPLLQTHPLEPLKTYTPPATHLAASTATVSCLYLQHAVTRPTPEMRRYVGTTHHGTFVRNGSLEFGRHANATCRLICSNDGLCGRYEIACRFGGRDDLLLLGVEMVWVSHYG